VHLWNLAGGEVEVLAPEAGNVWALDVSPPDGRTLAIGTQDGMLKLTILPTRREIAVLKGTPHRHLGSGIFAGRPAADLRQRVHAHLARVRSRGIPLTTSPWRLGGRVASSGRLNPNRPLA